MTPRTIGMRIAKGAEAGIFAGIVLSAFLIGRRLAADWDVWSAIKTAGAPFLGERALQPGFDALAVVVGAAVHLLVSAGWGAAFAVLFYATGRSLMLAGGLAWGVLVWLAMYHFVLPLVGLGGLVQSVPTSVAVAPHLLFGFTLALSLLVMRDWRARDTRGERHGRFTESPGGRPGIPSEAHR